MTIPAAAPHWAGMLLRQVFPSSCVFCGASGMERDLDLCTHCDRLLPTAAEPASANQLVPFAYRWPMDRMIRDLKFHGDLRYARLLGLLLARAAKLRVNSMGGSGASALPEAIVPMPLHAQRFRERGFNQAEKLARHAARELGLPLDTQSLVRVRHTPPQTAADAAERRRNMRGAFVARPAIPWRHVALLDDVVTTGSTLAAAQQALHQAGVLRVELWAIARAAR